MNSKICFLLLIGILLFSCKNEKEKLIVDDSLSILEKSVQDEPNGENISTLMAAYNGVILNEETDRKTLKNVLDKAYNLALDQNWEKELIGFTSTCLKEFPVEPGNEDKILLLINLMHNRNQEVTVNALKVSFIEAFPKSLAKDSLTNSLPGSILDSDSYLKHMAERVFEDPGEMGINLVNAREYVNACEAVALVLPSKMNTPRYLFNAAEISRTIKTYDKTLYLYDWVIDKYPQYEKAPMALFLKGFIFENDLKNMDKAKEIYRTFLESYPSHDLADDVQFLLDNIGKSNEEILEMIEQNKKEE